MDKRNREIVKFAKRWGLALKRGGKHWLLYDGQGHLVGVASVSASDVRSLKNLESQVRRAVCGQVELTLNEAK